MKKFLQLTLIASSIIMTTHCKFFDNMMKDCYENLECREKFIYKDLRKVAKEEEKIREERGIIGQKTLQMRQKITTKQGKNKNSWHLAHSRVTLNRYMNIESWLSR